MAIWRILWKYNSYIIVFTPFPQVDLLKIYKMKYN